MGGKLHDLAQADPHQTFRNLITHVQRTEVLDAAYRSVRKPKTYPGVDGITYEMIEREGRREDFLRGLQRDLISGRYSPAPIRRVNKQKEEGGVRAISVPTIRDRIVQAAMKLVLEPIFASALQPGSIAYRKGRRAEDGLSRILTAISEGKTWVLKLDVADFFGSIRHHTLFSLVGRRIHDPHFMHLLKLHVKRVGPVGIAQGDVLAPLLSNIYLNQVDIMLEEMKRAHPKPNSTCSRLEYARYSDDLIVCVEPDESLRREADARLTTALGELGLRANEDKTRWLTPGNPEFLGFLITAPDMDEVIRATPLSRKTDSLISRLIILARHEAKHGDGEATEKAELLLRGWINYFQTADLRHVLPRVRGEVTRELRRLGEGVRWGGGDLTVFALIVEKLAGEALDGPVPAGRIEGGEDGC